jgi:calcineurin-like phosphoesterase family protein
MFMGKTYYISDMHFGHANAIRFDRRPFFNVSDMEDGMCESWNKRVTVNDTVYILGDFCWSNDENEWIRILNRLNGKKILIKGNHDIRQMSNKLRSYFLEICDYKEINENHRKLILSHYPMLIYKNSYHENAYMIHGHVHNSTQEHILVENAKRKIWKSNEYDMQGNIINCGCMMKYVDYTPRSIEELIEVLENQKKECV